MTTLTINITEMLTKNIMFTAEQMGATYFLMTAYKLHGKIRGDVQTISTIARIKKKDVCALLDLLLQVELFNVDSDGYLVSDCVDDVVIAPKVDVLNKSANTPITISTSTISTSNSTNTHLNDDVSPIEMHYNTNLDYLLDDANNCYYEQYNAQYDSTPLDNDTPVHTNKNTSIQNVVEQPVYKNTYKNEVLVVVNGEVQWNPNLNHVNSYLSKCSFDEITQEVLDEFKIDFIEHYKDKIITGEMTKNNLFSAMVGWAKRGAFKKVEKRLDEIKNQVNADDLPNYPEPMDEDVDVIEVLTNNIRENKSDNKVISKENLSTLAEALRNMKKKVNGGDDMEETSQEII